jgi:hypothetical protein
MIDIKLEPAVSIPSGFRFGEVSSRTAFRAAASSAPSLGVLGQNLIRMTKLRECDSATRHARVIESGPACTALDV